MAVKNSLISKGFLLAGLMNMTTLLFSKFFTNKVIAEFDPVVMSNFGLVLIMLWGFAYIAVAKNFHHVKWMVAVFAVEKFIYGVVWAKWHLSNQVSEVFEKDTLAGLFYTVYGINDWLFFIFFLFVFFKSYRK